MNNLNKYIQTRTQELLEMKTIPPGSALARKVTEIFYSKEATIITLFEEGMYMTHDFRHHDTEDEEELFYDYNGIAESLFTKKPPLMQISANTCFLNHLYKNTTNPNAPEYQSIKILANIPKNNLSVFTTLSLPYTAFDRIKDYKETPVLYMSYTIDSPFYLDPENINPDPRKNKYVYFSFGFYGSEP